MCSNQTNMKKKYVRLDNGLGDYWLCSFASLKNDALNSCDPDIYMVERKLPS